jgi:hypothetical protein
VDSDWQLKPYDFAIITGNVFGRFGIDYLLSRGRFSLVFYILMLGPEFPNGGFRTAMSAASYYSSIFLNALFSWISSQSSLYLSPLPLPFALL